MTIFLFTVNYSLIAAPPAHAQMQFSSGANSAIIDQDSSGNAIFTINSAEKARVTPAGKMTAQEGLQPGDYTKEQSCNSAADAGTIRYKAAEITGPTSGLMLHLKFDESSGNAADSSGNGRTGTVNGNPVWRPTSGKLGGALEFDGSGDFVDVTSSVAYGAQVTFAGWFKTTTLAGEWGMLAVSGGSQSAYYGINFLPSGHCTGCVMGQTDTSGSWTNYDVKTSNSALTVNEWYHVAFTANNLSLKIYLNGALAGTKTVADNAGSTGTLEIGTEDDWGNFYFNGLMDDIRVYDHELTDTEIATLATMTEATLEMCDGSIWREMEAQ